MQTHSKNVQSRAALLKLGAAQEGILTEWPEIREALEKRVKQRA